MLEFRQEVRRAFANRIVDEARSEMYKATGIIQEQNGMNQAAKKQGKTFEEGNKGFIVLTYQVHHIKVSCGDSLMDLIMRQIPLLSTSKDKTDYSTKCLCTSASNVSYT